MTQPHFVHLEDNPADHALLLRVLDRHDVLCRLTLVDTLEDFQELLQAGGVDAVLADYHLAGFSGMDAWDWLRTQALDLPFILVSGAIGETTVADAMFRGVSDYVDKNKLQRLPMVLRRTLEFHRVRREQAEASAALADSRQRLLELTEHLQAGIDRERADIAREIHDEIGGCLAAVKLDLSWLARHAGDEDARHHVRSALDMVEHALGASQRIMRNLRPAVLDQGLMPALQWLTRTFAERCALDVQLQGRLRGEPNATQAMVVYRTAQEGLTNVLKHARATRIRLDISDLEGVLTLEMSDNGCGATPQDLAKLSSFGLLGLRERARSVGGWLDVATAPGSGLTLILSLPLDGSLSHDDWESHA